MNDSILEEMAVAIANDLSLDHNAVLRILQQYWTDKIAPVWQAEEILGTALNVGKPIIREDAIEMLKEIFEGHDTELGITWTTLEVALQEYHLAWKRLPADRHAEVQGVFNVWRKGNLIAHQVGLFPDRIHGNLPKALTIAKSLADETPGIPILIGCEPRHSDDIEAWLSVTREDDDLLVSESEATCSP
jgi:hypothetical protein